MRMRGWLGHRLPGNFYAGVSVPLRFRGRRRQRIFRYGMYPRVVWLRAPRQTRQVNSVRLSPWVLVGLVAFGLVLQFWMWILLGLAATAVFGLAYLGWQSRRTQV